MAIVSIAICQASTEAKTGSQSMPVAQSQPYSCESKETSPGSVSSDLVAPVQSKKYMWRIKPIGAAIWVKFGNPSDLVAEEGDGYLIADGETEYFGVSAAGETVAFTEAE